MDGDTDKVVMYESEKIERTLNNNFLTDSLRNSRKSEIEFLQKELAGLSDFFKTPLRVFDIGIGGGYVPLNFDKKFLENIESYIGIDNSIRELKGCEENIKKAKLYNKIKTFEFDATHLDKESFLKKLPLPFHTVICTFFTPGNFRPDEIKLELNKSGQILPYESGVLKPNKKFQKVFSDAYKLLYIGGKLILGSTYIESIATRLKQEEFYKKCGMNIITTENDEFTATKEGFWSERFTDEKIYSYLDWIPREDIKFINLDTEGFARMIVITKR